MKSQTEDVSRLFDELAAKAAELQEKLKALQDVAEKKEIVEQVGPNKWAVKK